ncbi:MAG: hypothetical protein CVU16_04560 [Betaproteobacteria bacterium HGW-Betaproteobacteria-10]|jgi:hypothetical protein|nr:MAG: hypothetical protein CVU16_04560 [Betaproteobacteria bacterium HGW-Betaproteobacteria-10]
MKIAAVALVLSITALPSFATDAGSAALAAIGEINGIALACAQPAIVSRARNAVTHSAAKTRANGEIFENATNAAYLKQGKDVTCPDAPTLAKKITEAEKNLSTAFATK